MRSRSLFFALALLPLLILAACDALDAGKTVEGSGTLRTETRPVANFGALSFSLPGSLSVEQANTMGLRIEADDNLLAHIVTRVEDGELKIEPEKNIQMMPVAPLRVYVTVRDLYALTLAGSGNMEANGIRAGDLSLSIAGSGDARLLDLQAEVLRVEIMGSGDVLTFGETKHQVISLAGSGNLNAGSLASENAEVTLAGSGSIKLRMRGHLRAQIAGSGSIHYIGNPQTTVSVVGSGTVQQISD